VASWLQIVLAGWAIVLAERRTGGQAGGNARAAAAAAAFPPGAVLAPDRRFSISSGDLPAEAEQFSIVTERPKRPKAQEL
jgi:hypothetical protein